MSKIKLIILTTAIIRPELHNTSIKLFYDKYFLPNKDTINDIYEIYHIINIDQPEKLKKYFTIEQTIKNFDEIIPNDINKIYIIPEEPSFLGAFKNIVNKIKELDLYSDKNIYWWFEDDWIGTNDLNFFEIIKLVNKFNNCALTLTCNSQLSSFRGGPVMNNYFFRNYFDIENMGIMNNTCDPERQVFKFLSAKSEIVYSRSSKYKRELKTELDKKISLIMIYFDTEYLSIVPDFGTSFYQTKFNQNIQYDKYIVMINNYDFENINYIEYNDKDNKDNINNHLNYTKTSLNDFIDCFNSNSIVYLIIKPYCFEDCGREFSQKYNLIKGWIKLGDPTTYS